MKLLSICIVQSCNYNCIYCPIKKNLYPIDFCFEHNYKEYPDPAWPQEYQEKNVKPINAIKNKYLLPWLDKYIDPKEWYIELTGGEPALYPEIDALIPELDCLSYKGVIKTNGSLSIPKSKGFIRTAAWHKGREMPKYYDKILIIKNPVDNWKEKEKHCIDNDISYRLLWYNRIPIGGSNPSPMPFETSQSTRFTEIAIMWSMGQLVRCPSELSSTEYEPSIFAMDEPRKKEVCSVCVHAISAENDIFGVNK